MILQIISMIAIKCKYNKDELSERLFDGLWCRSARNESNIGVWYYPNDSQVSTVDDSSPLHSVYVSG